MATQSTKTFLQLVNDTIDEAGAELASFAEDGSDFTTNTDAMMNRFKKWVRKAWKTIQQEQFDWEWMQSLAVVNLSPGIMFYSDTEISTGTADINPAIIVDVDDSVVVEGLSVSKVFDLTNSLPEDIDKEGIKQLGYMDLQYADYSLQNQHSLDFGLKSGGFRITRDGENKLGIKLSYMSFVVNDVIDLIAVGDTTTSITIVDAQNGDLTLFGLDGATVAAVEVGKETSSIYITYDAASGDFWAKLIEYAQAQSVLESFNIGWNMSINTTSGSVSVSGRITWPSGAGTVPVGPNSSISPFKYDLDIDGNVLAGSVMRIGDVIPRVSTKITRGPNDKVWYSFPCSMVISNMYSSASIGKLTLEVADDGGIADSYWTKPTPGPAPAVGPFAFSLFTYLLFYECPDALATLTDIVFYQDDVTAQEYDAYPAYPTTLPDNTVVVVVYDGSVESTYTYSLVVPYTQNNWIHSWKSYKWSEELSSNDYVSDVREVDQSSFGLIRHDTLGVTDDLPLQFIPWSSFENRFDKASMLPGQPTLVTEDPTGRWRFYPALDRNYTVRFRYGRQPQNLVEWDDVPKGLPEEWEDLIMWRALQYYGEYDEQPSVANRGRGNYKNLLLRFERQTRPKFYFKAKRLY